MSITFIVAETDYFRVVKKNFSQIINNSTRITESINEFDYGGKVWKNRDWSASICFEINHTTVLVSKANYYIVALEISPLFFWYCDVCNFIFGQFQVGVEFQMIMSKKWLHILFLTM